MRIISTNKAPAAVGPYSQAIEKNNVLYLSGQLGLEPTTGNFAGEDITSQTKQALKNLEAVLTEAGYAIHDITAVTILFKNISQDYPTVNQIYETFLNGHIPARMAYEVACLPKNGLIEIQAIAVK